MRVSKECLVKALDEGFIIWLKVGNKIVGNVSKWAENDARILLKVGVFSSVQKIENMKCRKITINKETKRMELVG